MQINKEIIGKLKNFTINGDTTQAEIGEYLKTGQPRVSRMLKYGEESPRVNARLPKLIIKIEKRIAKRIAKEQKQLTTA